MRRMTAWPLIHAGFHQPIPADQLREPINKSDALFVQLREHLRLPSAKCLLWSLQVDEEHEQVATFPCFPDGTETCLRHLLAGGPGVESCWLVGIRKVCKIHRHEEIALR